MALLQFLAKKPLLSDDDTTIVVDAIRASEKKTSGEIRVYVESRCKFVDALDRASQIFHSLKMDETEFRNAVLVYVAVKDHQLAVFADEGIFHKAGAAFWNAEVKKMLLHFNAHNYGNGIAQIVTEIGNALMANFPYNAGTDKNELPDDIVFGR